jgi:hypothetical protein
MSLNDRKAKAMRMRSQAFLRATAAAVIIASLTAAGAAPARADPKHHSARYRHYGYRGGYYYPNVRRSCAPFTRDKMSDAIVYGNSKFLSCGY